MAMRPIRKLFPTSNQTTNCHDICDSTCPYGCYSYPDTEYYYMPPPQLVPPQAPGNKNISPYIIISGALLVSLFLLLTYYLIIVRNCSNWNRRRQREEEFLDENRGPVIDHPIWYINTVGLQPCVISMITNVKYKSGDGLVDGTECSVCLNEFQDDDSLRLLPKCNHAFHIHCIDTWLMSHTNCPLCRAPIISETVTAVEPLSSANMSSDESFSSQRDIIVEVNSNNQTRDGEFQENGGELQEIECPETSKKEAMRRCVSMNSSIGASIGIPKGEGEKRGDSTSSSSSRMQRVIESASSIKRSFSYSGRSFFSRSH